MVRWAGAVRRQLLSSRIHHRACNLCEAICGLVIRVENGDIVDLRGDPDDPLSRGHVCPKAVALQDIYRDPDRLRHPLRRTPGGEWVRLGWDEAFDEVAGRLREVQRRHGRNAVGIFLGNPNVHNYGSLLFGPPLLRALKTQNRFSATSVDQLPHHLAAREMFGHQLLLPVPDIDRTSFFLVMGANPLASNGSMMTAPGFRRRLQRLLARGGRLVVVDPRRTETARVADTHLFIRPGTDALLLMALLSVIFAEGLEDLGRLDEHCDSLAELRSAAAPFSPERVAGATGIDPETIRRLARDFASSPTAACYGRFGLSTQELGGSCLWLVNALNIVSGNLDRPGGVLFTRPAVDVLARTGRGRHGRWKSRVRGLPEFGGELPVAVLAEEILTEGKGQIRALITSAGNPVLSTPNGRQLDRALAQLDFMVSIDYYLNETTRHADIILPPTSALEHDHYDLVFHLLAVRNVARYSPPLFEPGPDARHDWQILSELQRRLDDSPLPARLRNRLTARLGPRALLAWGLRMGPYGRGLRPFGHGLTLKAVERAKHGLDLGPLEPRLPDLLPTPGRRIELAPPLFLANLPRLETLRAAPPGPDELLLVGRRHLRSNNSWMHNFPRLVRGKERCTLLMNPADAARRGLEDGRPVEVVSATGRVVLPLEISDEMMPGVVSLPHGWGHDRPGIRLSVAAQHPGASVNDLTDDRRVDPLCGTAAFSALPVRVLKAERRRDGDSS